MAAAGAAESKTAPKYKLTYFNGKGLAEISRLLFHAAGVEFVDHRVEQDEWKTGVLKAASPWGQMPILEVNGKSFGQSAAIQRYIAREHGLFGSSDLEGLAIDSFYEALLDARTKFQEARFIKDEAEKKVKLAAYFKDVFPVWGTKFTAVLNANNEGKSWLVGSKISLADIALYHQLTYANEIDETHSLLNAFPALQALMARVAAQPGIAAWLAKRPATW